MNWAEFFQHFPEVAAQWNAPGGGIAQLLADAIDIADSTARSDIECHFLRDDDGWYNLSNGIDYDWLPQILRYLTARGLIESMTGDNLGANLARFVKPAAT